MLVLTVAAVGLAACADSHSATGPVQSSLEANRQNGGGAVGAVYTSTNGTAGNAVIAYARNNQGQLTRIGSFDTRGLGFGTGTDPLGSQFSVTLDEDHAHLYVVNAGSNDITVFDVDRGGSLSWRQRIGSSGTTPVSMVVRDERLYVLNQGSNSVASFRVHDDGSLSAGSRQDLPAGAGGASTVRVDHRVLIVTERTTNRLDLFPLDEDGRIGRPDEAVSNGATPFGFDVGHRGLVLVAEAGPNAVSTYRIRSERVRLDDGSVATDGAATCWLRLSPDERFAFTANAGSASITAFAVDENGTIAQESIGTLAPGSAPLDLDVTADNRFVYAVEAGTQGIGGFAIGADGHLTALAGATGVGGFEGLAAF
jgi:6-phosphogluconolactonase